MHVLIEDVLAPSVRLHMDVRSNAVLDVPSDSSRPAGPLQRVGTKILTSGRQVPSTSHLSGTVRAEMFYGAGLFTSPILRASHRGLRRHKRGEGDLSPCHNSRGGRYNIVL